MRLCWHILYFKYSKIWFRGPIIFPEHDAHRHHQRSANALHVWENNNLHGQEARRNPGREIERRNPNHDIRLKHCLDIFRGTVRCVNKIKCTPIQNISQTFNISDPYV
jgi:hypothetical protein